jgi:hypothetical protein
VVREDGRLVAQIGDGSGDLKNPVIGAGTQSQGISSFVMTVEIMIVTERFSGSGNKTDQG